MRFVHVKTIFLQILSIAKEQFVISLIFFAIIQKGEMVYIEQHSSDTDTFYDSGSERYQSGPLGIHEMAEAPEVDQRSVWQVYLLTYSRADVSAYPTRRSFAEAVIPSFSGTPSRIIQWVCCREKHKNGGLYYHMAIKLHCCQRWMPAKTFLTGHHGISVHFSDVHFNYYSTCFTATITRICGMKSLQKEAVLVMRRN